MRAGRLRDVATLKNPATGGDAYSTKGGYTTVATDVRCELRYLNARELIAAKQTGTEISAEILCRPRAEITDASRFVIDGVTLEVVGKIPTGTRRQDLRLPCKIVS